jgi:hypothetical protein
MKNETEATTENLEPQKPSRKLKREQRKQAASNGEEARSLASGSLVILLVLIAVSIFSLSTYTKSSKNIEVLGPPGISINVDLSSPVFQDAYNSSSTPEFCNSPKPYQGISGSTLFLFQPDSNAKPLGSIKLGDAVEYNYLSCKFKAFLPLDDSFTGGNVSIYLRFPFGDSETFTLDVGEQRPFKIDLKLNLD